MGTFFKFPCIGRRRPAPTLLPKTAIVRHPRSVGHGRAAVPDQGHTLARAPGPVPVPPPLGIIIAPTVATIPLLPVATGEHPRPCPLQAIAMTTITSIAMTTITSIAMPIITSIAIPTSRPVRGLPPNIMLVLLPAGARQQQARPARHSPGANHGPWPEFMMPTMIIIQLTTRDGWSSPD